MMAVDFNQKRFVIHPARFAMWLFMVSSILLFGALTSAFIVQKGIETDKNTWLHIFIPSLFYYTTAVLVLSSITVQWAVSRARKNDFKQALIGLTTTFVLGVFFLIGQLIAWERLAVGGVTLASSAAGNYVYVLTGVHGVHIIAGLTFVLVVLVRTLKGRYTTNNIIGYENCASFWHFLGLLWMYLFIFLLINK